MASEVKVNTINEYTTSNGVTIDGVELKDGSVKGNGTGRKNYIINGNFDIWQRGTSGTSGYCSADRWYFGTSGATGTLAQGSFTAGQTDVPNNPKYYANLTTTVADDNTNILQRIEDVYTLAGETITISFWAKHTTNAPTSFLIKARQYFGSGGSTAVVINSPAQSTTTSWQKYTYTVTLGSISGKTIGSDSRFELEISNPNNETFDLQIAQVQVEKGSVATDFEVRPIAEELVLCQRYFELAGSGSIGRCTNTTSVQGIGGQWKVNKRTAPTLTLSDTSVEMGEIGVASRTSSGSSLSSFHAADEYGVGDIGLDGFSSLTSPNMVGIRQNFLNVDAEL